MTKIFNESNLKKILTIFILIQPLLDTYILFEEKIVNIFKMSPSTIIRLLFVLIIGIFSIFIIKKKKSIKYYFIYAGLITIYSILHLYSVSNFTTLDPNDFNYSNFSEIFYIIRLVIPIFIIIVCSNIKFNNKELRRIFYGLVFLTSGTIFVTNILKISMGSYVTTRIKYSIIDWFVNNIHEVYSFYETSTRGYFSFANMISSLLFGFCGILFYKLLKELNIKNVLILLLQMFAMFMLGTKVAAFGFILVEVVMLFAYLFFSVIHKEFKFNYKSFGVALLILGVWVITFNYSPCKNRMSWVDINDNLKENKVEIAKKKTTISKVALSEEEIKQFLLENYEDYGINEEYMFNYYPYEYDYEFWYGMLNAPFTVKTDNRLMLIRILDRMKSIDNREIQDELFGISYTRMSNIAVLERDFLSQYYSMGILGSILLTFPLILIIIVYAIMMFINPRKFNFYNTTILVCLATALVGSCYCGNTLDNLTFSIIYAFFCGCAFKDFCLNNDKDIEHGKVTIFALHLGFGGVEKYLSSLCKMLDDKYEIEIITTYKLDDKPAFAFSNKVNIKYLIDYGPNREKLKYAIKHKKIFNIIKEGFRSLKILYLKYSRNIYAIKNTNSEYIITTRIFHNNLVRVYSNRKSIKIATEHNFHNNNKRYIKRLIKSIKKYDYFVVVSRNLKDFYKDKIGKTKCVFIPNVLDELPKKNSKLDKKNIITVGRLCPEKGQKDLLDVFNLVVKKLPDTNLYLVGDGALREELYDYAKKLKIDKNVIFTGFLKEKDKEEYLLDSSLFVLTSFTESFGLVLIEAMSYKLPCIAFDSADGARELLSNDVGLLIKNRNIDDMANKIINLLNNDKLSTKYSKKSYDKCQEYLIENVKKEWLKILK